MLRFVVVACAGCCHASTLIQHPWAAQPRILCQRGFHRTSVISALLWAVLTVTWSKCKVQKKIHFINFLCQFSSSIDSLVSNQESEHISVIDKDHRDSTGCKASGAQCIVTIQSVSSNFQADRMVAFEFLRSDCNDEAWFLGQKTWLWWN